MRNRQRTLLRYAFAGVTVTAALAAGAYFVFYNMDANDASAKKSKSKANYEYMVCPGQSIQLESFDGDMFRWTPSEGLSNPETQKPFASPRKTTVYSATVYTKLDTVISIANKAYEASNGVAFEKLFATDAYDSYNVVLAAHSESGEKLDLEIAINNVPLFRMDATTDTQSATAIWENIDENKSVMSLRVLSPKNYNGPVIVDGLYVVLLGKETLLTQVFVDKDCAMSASVQ